MLEIKNLTKKYGSFVALSKINLSVANNSFLALLGKNGAGKSTFIGIMSSLISKTSGKVIVDGKDLDHDSLSIKQMIGIVPQEINLAVFETPLQILVNQAGYFGIDSVVAMKRAKKYLKVLDLWDKRNDPIMTLSGGMKRRLMLARALIHDPKILFLDEPTVGVDIEVRYKIWDFLRELQDMDKTVVLTTHYLEEAEKLCDRIAIIDQGVIKYEQSMKDTVSDRKCYNILLDIKNKKSNLKELISSLNLTNIYIRGDTVEIKTSNSGFTIDQILSAVYKFGLKVISIAEVGNVLEDLFYNITREGS